MVRFLFLLIKIEFDYKISITFTEIQPKKLNNLIVFFLQGSFKQYYKILT